MMKNLRIDTADIVEFPKRRVLYRRAVFGNGKAVTLYTLAGIEERLREAARTLRRLPLGRNDMPATGRSGWPEVFHTAADRADWIVGADSPDYLARNEAEQNRVRLVPTAVQIREMGETLEWLHHIRNQRDRRVVFAKAEGKSYERISRLDGRSREGLRKVYRRGLRLIAEGVNDG